MVRFLLFATIIARASPLAAQSLVITNKQDATASIISLADGRTVATLPTGQGPHEVAISADGKLAVVADYGAQVAGNTLTVIDVIARRVLATHPFGDHQRPHGILFLPDNRTVVVTAERGGAIVMVDAMTGALTAEHAVGQPLGHMVALSPDAKTAYTANIQPGTLSIVDLAGNNPPVIVKVGTQTEAIGASPGGRTVWLGSNNTGMVFVVDVGTRTVVDSIQTSGWPYRIAFTPDASLAIVTNPESDEIWLIDTATRSVRKRISVQPTGGGGRRPFGIAVAPAGDRAWITMSASAEVGELDLRTGMMIRWMATGQVPDGIGYAR